MTAKKTPAREVKTADDLTPAERRAAEEAAPGKAKSKDWKGATAKGKKARTDRPRATAHPTRAQETRGARATHEVADEPWVRPATLPQIPARPGMVQRWIRVASRGTNDATNVSRKFREGWKPRGADTLPKNFVAPTIAHGSYTGCIGVEGMILCEMPKGRNDQRNAFYKKRNERATAAINDQLAQASRHGHAGFGRIQKAEGSKLVREVAVQADEAEDV